MPPEPKQDGRALRRPRRAARHAGDEENGKKIAEGMLESTPVGATLRYAAAQALTGTGIFAEVAPGQRFWTVQTEPGAEPSQL